MQRMNREWMCSIRRRFVLGERYLGEVRRICFTNGILRMRKEQILRIAVRLVVVGPESGDDRRLLSFKSLVALGAGIAFGFVLAVCFLEGKSEGVAQVRNSLSDSSFTTQVAATGETVRLHSPNIH